MAKDKEQRELTPEELQNLINASPSKVTIITHQGLVLVFLASAPYVTGMKDALRDKPSQKPVQHDKTFTLRFSAEREFDIKKSAIAMVDYESVKRDSMTAEQVDVFSKRVQHTISFVSLDSLK